MTTINVEILKKRIEEMSNYDMDEIERLKEREKRSRGIKPNWPQSVELGKDETPYTAVDIELSDNDFKRVALQAHERDITFNKMVGLILKDGLGKAEHRFEHDNKPQLLNEDK
jgi:hypothetical protein|tara:strand:- start:117 stop:455 length:339 start_codon:yes stop_codon:yes gene_type:complete